MSAQVIPFPVRAIKGRQVDAPDTRIANRLVQQPLPRGAPAMARGCRESGSGRCLGGLQARRRERLT